MDKLELRLDVDAWQDGSLGDPVLFVEKLRQQGLSDETIKIVVDTIDNICQYCWDYEGYGCVCMRDE